MLIWAASVCLGRSTPAPGFESIPRAFFESGGRAENTCGMAFALTYKCYLFEFYKTGINSNKWRKHYSLMRLRTNRQAYTLSMFKKAGLGCALYWCTFWFFKTSNICTIDHWEREVYNANIPSQDLLSLVSVGHFSNTSPESVGKGFLTLASGRCHNPENKEVLSLAQFPHRVSIALSLRCAGIAGIPVPLPTSEQLNANFLWRYYFSLTSLSFPPKAELSAFGSWFFFILSDSLQLVLLVFIAIGFCCTPQMHFPRSAVLRGQRSRICEHW